MTEDSSTPSAQREAAVNYAARGWRPVLLHGVRADGKTCTCAAGPKCRTAGKHPVDNEWQKAEPLPVERAGEPWTGWRAGHNVGIATGEASGFWVLDIDPEKGGTESAARLAREHPEMFDPTIVVLTGSGGWHYYFTMPDFPVGNGRGRLKDYPGIDVRGTGGQVVAPPSRTDKGGYRRATHSADTISAAPEWLLDMIRPVEKALTATAHDDAPAVPVADLDPVEAKRLARYFKQARQVEIERLIAMKDAATDDPNAYRGEPWDATTYAVGCNLLELAYSPWNTYTVEKAHADLLRYAPRDAEFGEAEIEVKWESALKKVDGVGRPMPPKPDADVEAMMADLPMAKQADALQVEVEAAMTATQRPSETPEADDWVGFGGSTPIEQRGDHGVVEWQRRTWDDIGNGRRIVDHFGSELRYVAEAESWARYADGAWSFIKPNVVLGLCQDMIAERLPTTEALTYSEVPDLDENGDDRPSERELFLRFVAKQRFSARVSAAISMASGRDEIFASTNDFDAQPHLFNARNGVVDLKTGALLPHDPALLLMKRADVAYDPAAPCVEWQRFLDRVIPDEERQRYLQRMLGYSLTGETISQAFFIHYGVGANGKSVMLMVVRAVVGDYGQTIPRETLLSKKDSEHPTSIARMIGMRFLEVSETAPGRRLDEESVKNLTGGEKTTARFMGKDFFDFTPTGKIHYVTNHLPLLSDAHSIWRRLHLFRWGVVIPEAEQDPRLAERLIETEAAGILAWLVRGAQAWYEQGLNPPQSMYDELQVYRRDSDTFGEFLAEKTMPAPESVTPLKQLHESYLAWCFSASIKKPMTRQSFSAVLKERGYEVIRQSAGVAYKGLVLVAAQQPATLNWAEL